MDVTKDGRSWRIGTAADVAWIAGQTTEGISITTAIPPLFDAYASFYEPDGVDIEAHERAVIDELINHTADQPWWLGYLETGAHDIVFPRAPQVSLYWDWAYVLVEAGPEQALTWRTGHMRHFYGSLPDLFFPADQLLARVRALGRHLDQHRRQHGGDQCPTARPVDQCLPSRARR